LQSRSALEGERKQVTVLFADVQGSMELAEQLDPEAWTSIMNRFFEILSEGVERFEGFVDKFTGDGIMALFGAPIAHEDHAQRACYAALHLRDELTRYTTEVKRKHGVSFSTRMGLNSGEVVVGKIGDDLRMDYTAQGHTVGLAQRMENLASPDTCYLTGATAALAGGYFSLEDLGDFQVKGVATPVRVHRLGGIGASRTRFDLSRARGLSRFVGRASDLRTLEDALEQTAAGNGQVVGVMAEAGTGKSRLCFEFLERCRARGMQVYEGRAVAHGRNIPFLPVLEVFRAYFGVTLEDDDRSAREKIAGRMVLLDHSFTETLPLLFDFLGLGDSQRPAPRLDPEARQRQLIGVMRQVIQSVSATRPTITMIEDLHWLDPASAEFIEHMVDARAGSRHLLLLNFRPEYRAEWMQKSWYRQIPLTPLGREAIAELLTDLLGSDASVAALAGPIHARTGGNPFFTEEVAQSLIETGHLEGKRGAYRLVTPIDKLEVPATVQAVLAARIDRLAEREKRLLQVASVIGKDFAEPLLAAVAELRTEQLKAALALLSRGEFIHEQAIYPVTEYAFKHPLTQEVALGSLLKERRRHVHAAVARAIESESGEHLDECAALLAHHWEEAGEPLIAARWHRRAARWAGHTEFVAPARHWRRVRALLRGLAVDTEVATLGIAACTQLLSLSMRVGMELDEARALLEEGQSFANAIGDRRAHLTLSIFFARVLFSNGDAEMYLKLSLENQRAALEIDDLRLQANAQVYLVDALGVSGRLPETLQMAEDGLARFPDHTRSHVTFTFWRGVCLVWLGRLQEGREELDRCLHLAEELGVPDMASYALAFMNVAHYYAHDPDRALATARQIEEFSRSLGEPPLLVAHAQTSLACAHIVAGRAADAVEPLRIALEIHRRVEQHSAGPASSLLAEALLAAGDLPAAQLAAEQAIELAVRLKGLNEAQARGVLARAMLRRRGAAAREEAEAELAKAAEMIERYGARTIAPLLCEWRAELATVLGDDATCTQLLQQALQSYEEIGAPLQVARLRKEMGL
jgi:adenylate cyclase